MDQCVAHPRDTTALKNIEVISPPPNCISHLQPLDMGNIYTSNASTETTHMEGSSNEQQRITW